MQPIPGLDPEPKRRVVGIHVQSRGDWRVIFGLAIVGYGALMTAAINGSVAAEQILSHWYFPCALTVLGLYKAFRACSGMGRAIGGVVTLVGLWWLASEVYGFDFNIGRWWPLAIVALGVMVILKATGHAGDDGPGMPYGSGPTGPYGPSPFSSSSVDTGMGSGAATATVSAPAPASADAGPVSAFAFWSGVHRRVSVAFKRANLAAFMGGIELDLRPSVTVGGQAVVELFVVMGGIEITVPPDWTVHNEALVIMGGIDDRNSGSAGAQQTLIIRGLILMGGVEIKT